MFKKFVFAIFLSAMFSIPALAGVNVNSPGNNSNVGSSFNLSAYASECSSQGIASMGYSLDSGTDTSIVYSGSINTSVWASPGGHTVHVKAWGASGAVCVTDVYVNVGGVYSLVPDYARSNSNIETYGNWIAAHDTGAAGSAWGQTWTVSSPSRSGISRRFSTSYSNYGAERYSVSFGDDQSASNFMYDVWVNLADPSIGIANLELDMNQVMPNGQTVIFGIQCDAWSNTWDFSVNRGSASSPSDQWAHSSAYCNAREWGTNEWHHIQMLYSRNDSGWVTYKTIWLDGKQFDINVTAFSAYNLGWAPTLLANVQVDGYTATSGGSTFYIDGMTVYRW